jgi:hypothetical protein
MTHNVYTFTRRYRVGIRDLDRREVQVEFGPYKSEHEAKDAFQRAYGYWPATAVAARPWKAAP